MAIPNLWRTKRQRYRMQAEICPVCTEVVFPPREICPHCHQPMNQSTASGLVGAPTLVLPVDTVGLALASLPAGAD